MNLDVNSLKLSHKPLPRILHGDQANNAERQQLFENQYPSPHDPDVFRLLVENSADGLALFENQKLVYASPSMNRIFGCRDFSKFRSYTEVLQNIHPDDYRYIEKMYAEGMENQHRHQTYTYRFKCEDGSYSWIENSVTRFFDDAGNNYRNIVICRDVNKNKSNEIELNRHKEMFRAITDNSGAFIYTKDLDGRFTFVSKAFESTFNMKSDDFIGLTDEQITCNSSSENFRKNDLIVIESGQPLITEEDLELPDGKHTAISVKVPLYNIHGNITGILGLSTDITDRKRAEQNVIDLKNKLELAMGAGKMGIWEWYVDRNRVEWYGKQAQLFGISSKEFGGTIEDVQQLMHPDDRNKGIKSFHKAIEEKVEFTNTYRVIWPDGSVHWLYSHGNPVFDSCGNPLKVVGVTHDITDQKLYRDKILSQNRELSRINAMKDKLFSVISHDLVNPLNSLLGFIQLLQMNYRNESVENTGRYISLVSKSANSLAELLQSLSQWSKSQRRKIKVAPTEINPAALVNEVAELLSANLNNKNLELINEIDIAHKAYADEKMVKTILRNFMTNAIKFSYKNGNIRCSAGIRHGRCIIRISDDGVGINPEKLKHIFNVTANGSEEGTSGEKGTGLGLIICRELAELNHGKVSADSTPGKGSDFYLEIPENQAAWESAIPKR